MNNKRILIIDDDDEAREYCQQILEEEYCLGFADNGKTGLSELNNKTYDVVLLDLRLPDMDGLDILKVIKSRYPQCSVIMMSAYTSLPNQSTAEELGSIDYLIKPFAPEKLLSSIKNCF